MKAKFKLVANPKIKSVFSLCKNPEIKAVFKINAVVSEQYVEKIYERINEVQTHVDEANERIDDLYEIKADREELSEAVDDLNSKITANSNAISQEILNRKNADIEIRNSISDLDEKVDGININLTRQIDDLEQDVNDKYNELIRDIDDLTDVVEEDFNTLNDRITNVADELQQTIEENVVALQQEDTALQNQINAHSQTLTNYNQRITNNANTISQEIINRQNADDNLQNEINKKQDKLTAGDNISIVNNVISATFEPGASSFADLQGSPYDNANLKNALDSKQNNLVSGQNIKTLNNESLLGEGNIDITSAQWGNITGTLSNQTDLKNALDGKQPVGDYALKSEIPTKTSDIINDSGFITADYHDNTKQDVLTEGTGISISETNEISVTNYNNIVSNANAGASASATIASYGDIVYHDANEFQVAGDYATNTALTQGLATKQDNLTQGNNITIANNVISVSEILSAQVESNTQRIEDLTVARFPNVVIIGTPHIEGGQVSNYSTTSYLQFPFIDISRGQPFDIYFSFTTTNDVTTQQNILDSYFGIALAIQNGKGIMALSSNGTNWDIGSAIGTNTLLPNTTYYVKYSWTGTEYNASLSTNDETYVPDMRLTSSLSPHKTTIFIGGSPNLFGPNTAHPFKGTINFNKSKVVVNGLTVWEGMADVGLASRANVSLNNLDEAGEARFNAKQDILAQGTAISINNNTISADIATTSTVGVVKPDGTSITIESDGTISASSQESNWRNRWINWEAVPADATLYPTDYHGTTTPTYNDYMIVEDTSDYHGGYDNECVINNSYYASGDYGSGTVSLDFGGRKYSTTYSQRTPKEEVLATIPGIWIKVKVPGTYYTPVEVYFYSNEECTEALSVMRGTEVVNHISYGRSSTVETIRYASAEGFSGTWRFSYKGTWATDNKNGWKPEYQIEDTLPIATSTEMGIAKLYTSTGTNTDGSMDQNSITTALGNKQDTITNTNKLSSDLVDDTNHTNKFVTAQEKTTWNAKQNAISDLNTIRSNAQAGKNASDTISGYGDIVTHNASEFQPTGDYATNTALTQGLATKQNILNSSDTIVVEDNTLNTNNIVWRKW